MESVKIKICGLTRKEDIKIVNEMAPDYIGFVFAESRRKISFEKAYELKKLLSPTIKAVGVFVNEEITNIVDLCNSQSIDVIQLHGEEDASYVKRLQRQVKTPIIKAFRVRSLENVNEAKNFPADLILFDTFQIKEYGGSGKTFDWSLLRDMNRPYFLAGGIQTGNVMEAVTLWRPYGVDVSSGVETNGYKDRNKIRELIRKVRSVR